MATIMRRTFTDLSSDWVANNATKHILASYATMKEARLASHAAYIRGLPHYSYYEEFKYYGHPPLHPHIVHTLSLQIAEADYQLRRDLDSDWRSCVIRYPEVLAYYFSIVKVTLPSDPAPPPAANPLGATPPLGFIAPPPSRALSYAGSTVSALKKKKERAGSKTPEPKASSSSVAGPASGAASSAAGSGAGRNKGEPDAGDLGGALAKLLVGAAKAEGKSAAASAAGASAASTSAARRGPLAGRGTAMPEAALRNYRKRRSIGSDYVLSGYAAHGPPPHIRAVSDWHALSARFP
jgi:hypothetical protein